jgi:hypothetical protein
MSLLAVDGGEWKSTDNQGICGMRGVYIGHGIAELLCQTKVNEEGDQRRVIMWNHEVSWLDVTMDAVSSMQ